MRSPSNSHVVNVAEYRAGIALVSRWFRAGFALVSRGFAGFRLYATVWYREVSRGIAMVSQGIAGHTLRYVLATLDLFFSHHRSTS